MRQDVSGWQTRLTDAVIAENTASGIWRNKTLADLLDEQLARDPEQILIIQDDRQLSARDIDALREIFTELGFRGPDVDMRARTFVAYYGLEPFLHVRQSKRERLAEARRRVALLTQPLPRDRA